MHSASLLGSILMMMTLQVRSIPLRYIQLNHLLFLLVDILIWPLTVPLAPLQVFLLCRWILRRSWPAIVVIAAQLIVPVEKDLAGDDGVQEDAGEELELVEPVACLVDDCQQPDGGAHEGQEESNEW